MNPYQSLDEKSFWAPAVGRRNMLEIDDLWAPKFPVARAKIVTFGSCFAQHIGRALATRGFGWTDMEPAPTALPAEEAATFNYGIFSARTGNIYTVSLLKQWTEWALGKSTLPEEVWEKDGRFYDPFRPVIEPNGFESVEEVLRSRQVTIDAFAKCIREADIFVFTMGLTESWFHTDGYEYPMCPGTVAGTFDPDKHKFRNQRFPFIIKTLKEVLKTMREVNPKLKVLLTVSPVPLTATMSGNHVLLATMESKSVLRAVAGDLKSQFRFIDYFPSYEIINAPPFRGSFFAPNARSVVAPGVAHVMDLFFRAQTKAYPKAMAAKGLGKRGRKAKAGGGKSKSKSDVVCEEELLGAFGS